jgi:hypothetical protein
MKRFLSLFACLALAALVSACVGVGGIRDEQKAGQPTAYAKVIKEPNPLLLGHWRRLSPVGLNKPWVFQYYLTKTGDKYAVYYFYDSKRKNMFSGWADFSIDGDSMTSSVDGVSFFVKDGQVYMLYPGRTAPNAMEKLD